MIEGDEQHDRKIILNKQTDIYSRECGKPNIIFILRSIFHYNIISYQYQ